MSELSLEERYKLECKLRDEKTAEYLRVDLLLRECEEKFAAKVEGHLGKEQEQELIDKLEASQAKEKVLRDALEAIRQYGSDTLFGRADGPDDRAWQRDGVLEMTRRARIALTQPTDDSALQNLIIEQRHEAIVTYRKFQEAVDDGLALKAALSAERERCARCVPGNMDWIADEIRALGD